MSFNRPNQKQLDRLEVFEALISYAKNQQKPISEVINEFIPNIISSPRIQNESNNLEELEKKISRLEYKIKQDENYFDQRVSIKAQSVFWKGVGIIALIAGLIATLVKLFGTATP